jgi:uncharacterized protein
MNFADTGIFLALHHRLDQHHKDAVSLWPTLEKPVHTSNLVLVELAKLLGQRVGYRYAADQVANLYSAREVKVLFSTRLDELDAIRWMRKFADQRIGFTDCVSFAIMRRHKIRTAFTFDRHFRLAGFHVIGLK